MVESIVVIMIVFLFLVTFGVSFAISCDGVGISFFAFPICIAIWIGIAFYAENQKAKQKEVPTYQPQVTVTQQTIQKDDVEMLSEKLENLKQAKKIDSLKKELEKLGGK